MKTNKEVFAGIELLEGSLSEDFKEKYVNQTSKLGQEIKIGRPANKYGRTSLGGLIYAAQNSTPPNLPCQLKFKNLAISPNSPRVLLSEYASAPCG
jgi:hypothetical protein